MNWKLNDSKNQIGKIKIKLDTSTTMMNKINNYSMFDMNMLIHE